MSKSDRFGGSVYTQEGNLAGSRAARLEKARLDHLNAVARERAELSASSTSTLSQLRDVNSKFKRQILESQDSSDSSVYGLKTRDEFAKAQDESIRRKGLTALQKAEEDRLKQSEKDKALLNKSKKRKRKEREKMKNLLSFSFEEENLDEGEDTSGTSAHASASNNEREKKQKTEQDGEDVEAEDKMVLTKDPTVETSFLPDRDREEQRRREIVRLKQEWLSSQDKVKQEIIEVVYSYWDGSGHRRKVKVTKGTTIESFLETVRKSLIKEFPHLRSASAETLMYVKEDIIIPHEATFYDLIMSKARGKTGPLFNFDVKDDIRLVNDVRTQTDHSHAGKICERHWYERNKHIYPASRWEVLDLSNVFADLARKAPTEQDLIKLVDVTPPEQP